MKNFAELDAKVCACTEALTAKLDGTNGKRAILLCGGTGCLSSNSMDIKGKFDQLVAANHMEEKVSVNIVGCFGFCSQGPFVKIFPEDTLYRLVKIEDVEEIFNTDIIGGQIVERLLYVEPLTGQKVAKQDDINFYKKQKRVALHGGGGFPSGRKWQFAKNSVSDQKYVVCNGDEGDPGAFMDRSILEGNLYAVIEGMMIAGYAIGASEGYFYVRARGTDRMCSFGDWVALSDVCDELTASVIAPEVSDGVIAPGYTEGALAILKAKRKGSYNVVQIDPDFMPKEQETKEVFGIDFHQGRNNFKIGEHLLHNIVTENRELPESAKIDLIVSLITLKYTQSNSVCFAYDGQAIGVGAGQQSRIHCTRLAGTKADTWFLRQHPKTLALPFRADLGRANRDNVIDGYINGNEEDVCADGIWQHYFIEQPERLTEGDKKAWLASRRNVALGSDAFFPFSDNIKRAFASGVKYIAEPGGSIRDDLVIEECNKKDMVMAFTGMRLFHH